MRLPHPPSAAHADPEIAELTALAEQAHRALMRGDLERYHQAIAVADDFVLMAPFGGKPTRGAELTPERWESVGRFFRNGSDSTLELIEAYRAAEMIVLVAVERTRCEVGGLALQDWALRVTLVFRRDGDRWLLVHRHADPLANGVALEQAAALARAAPPAP